jgi:hypothetical protein
MTEAEPITLEFFGGPADGREISFSGKLPDIFVIQEIYDEDEKRAYDYHHIPNSHKYQYYRETAIKENDEV